MAAVVAITLTWRQSECSLYGPHSQKVQLPPSQLWGLREVASWRLTLDDVAPSLIGDTNCNPHCLVNEALSQRHLFSGLGVQW